MTVQHIGFVSHTGSLLLLLVSFGKKREGRKAEERGREREEWEKMKSG